MVFFVTTVAFVQTLVVLYLLPMRSSLSRAYPYIRALLLSLSLFLIALLGNQVVKTVTTWLGVPYESPIFAYFIFGLISFLYLRFFFAQPSEESILATPEVDPATEPEREPITYEKSGLSDTQLAEGWYALEQLMLRDKPYVNPDLSLDDLAERLKLSRQHVSQILNQKSGRNFYAYINEYRVVEMKRLLKQNPSGRILEIAFRVGFQSKTTLNTYFKKVTGYSPTQYQQFLANQRTERLPS